MPEHRQREMPEQSNPKRFVRLPLAACWKARILLIFRPI